MRNWLRRIFTPHGNLLAPDLVAEVTVHVLASGTRKTYANKIDTQRAADLAVQGLLMAAIEVAQPFHVGINWQALAQMYPYRPPGAPPAPPPPVPPT